MNARRITKSFLFVAAMTLAVLPLLAGEPTIRSEVNANGLIFAAAQGYSGATLTVVTPAGDHLVFPFSRGQALQLPVNPGQGIWGNGLYKWELVLNQEIPAGKREALERIRNNGTPAELKAAMAAAGMEPRAKRRLSGAFTIAGGKMVLPVEEELNEAQAAAETREAPAPVRGGLNEDNLQADAAGDVTPMDQVIADDLIVTQSICVGTDCVNGESFGFDTIRLKENNVRIKFQDTSNSGSFPYMDWEIQANSSTNGGTNHFAINDVDNGRTPFKIEATAPSNSLFVADSGEVGFGTGAPVGGVELHVLDGDTPTLRLQQDGSSGFGTQTWDLAGNETNFFIRDVNNGSQLPLRIIPGADSNSIYVNSDNRVGFLDTSPSAQISIANNGEPGIGIENTTGGHTVDWYMVSASDMALAFNTAYNSTDAKLTLDSSGNVTSAGMITQGSSRTIKKNLLPVNTAEVLAKVLNLPVLTWQYNSETDGVSHVGPTAEDFHAAFGLGADAEHLAPGDTAGVALAAIQELARENAELKKRLAQLEAAVAALTAAE